MKILIIEDKGDHLEQIKADCLSAAADCHIQLQATDFAPASSLDDALKVLGRSDFGFDIIIADIYLEDRELPISEIRTRLLKQDVLGEAKFIVLTGNATTTDAVLEAIHSGAHNFVLKGSTGIHSLSHQLKLVIQQIKRESIWSMVGRFSPPWKRKEFSNFELWDKLKEGAFKTKAVLWCDLSRSSEFVKFLRDKDVREKKILAFFRSFFTEHSKIIEKEDYQGIIDKFIGDEILAYFCAEKIQDETEICHRAISAALDIRDYYKKWFQNKKNSDPDLKRILNNGSAPKPNIRILVHCGEVMWGVLGSESFASLTLMTRTMEKGKRLIDHSNPDGRIVREGEVCITNDVYESIDKTIYKIGARRTAKEVRNFDDVLIYPVLGRNSQH